jgi:hypothetical protein
MKIGLRFVLGYLFILLLPIGVYAQTDSLRLMCPLDEAVVVPPSKNAIRYDPPDLCIVLMSKPDSIVKACIESRVTNVEQNEEGTWDIVLFYRNRRTNKDYYFWYTGLTRSIVRRNEILKMGQALGHISPGGKMEMLMYEFETQLDPSKYLDCKTVLKSE